MSEYEYEAASEAGFIAQIVRYVSSGHLFYVRVVLPEQKDERAIDAKLLERYGAVRSRMQRKRRNLKDAAGIHYIRYQRTAVLMLSKGRHDQFYEDHGANYRDIRRTALHVGNYSIRYTFSEEDKRMKVFVRLTPETYRKVKAHMVTVAGWNSFREKDRAEREFMRLPYQPYGPVYKQLKAILKEANRARRRRGFEKLDVGCIRVKKRLVKVFVEREQMDREAA